MVHVWCVPGAVVLCVAGVVASLLPRYIGRYVKSLLWTCCVALRRQNSWCACVIGAKKVTWRTHHYPRGLVPTYLAFWWHATSGVKIEARGFKYRL
ncbi:hypothetical protein F4678DRAFT_429048 [Xylaria arbuscula]|nr:hypothetical protein F4678DRAFT_429048 [Xylaria arbuscula]